MNNGILIFDPVPYFGGSKQVAKSVVKQRRLNENHLPFQG